MAVNVAISGFGRIGRLVLRSIIESKRKDINVVAINDLAPIETNAFLLANDTVHGPLNEKVSFKRNKMIVGRKNITVLNQRDPQKLPWKRMKIDVALECTGLFTSKDKAAMHIKAGAKKVLVSAPCTNADKTIVYGVNEDEITKEDLVVSNASCTTNCLAPVAKVLHDKFKIVHGYMTTIHAFTGDQSVLDTFHSDLRRARAASLSMIPTSTGAAKAVGLVMPELSGKLDGTAIRVPTPNVSLIDFKFVSKKRMTVDSINKAMSAAADIALLILSTVILFLETNLKSINETLGVGTLIAVPSNLPESSGITSPTAFAAPVDVGIIDNDAARALLKSE